MIRPEGSIDKSNVPLVGSKLGKDEEQQIILKKNIFGLVPP